MPRLQARPVVVSERERVQLETLVRRQSCPQQLALRARIILAAADGEEVRSTMRRLGVARSTVQQWRRRWATQRRGSVVERLADAPRPGTPPIFSAEQICAIVALACEPPSASGRPITHWTQQELAEEAVRRGIVESISPDSVGRFLKRSLPQTAPHARLAQRQA